MARFLVVGTGPLIDEDGATFVSGQCLRTIHFVRPMLEAGHEVRLLTVPIPGTESGNSTSLATRRLYGEDFAYHALTTHDERRIVPALRRLMERTRFDGCVGINAYPAYLLARAAPEIPFWADLNGWTMAEGQTRAALVGHDQDYNHFWRMEAAVLLEADRFSTVSARQGDALYGELALAGRLNGLTFNWSFASPVPNAVYPLYSKVSRGAGHPGWPERVPADRPVVLWSGGFNTWTDVGMLTEALESAMAVSPSLFFAATGGSVRGHDDQTFERFRALARDRLPGDRVALLGWTATETVLALHAGATVGINIDSRNTETHFGARNRLTNMMGAGLPVATTRGTEIAAWIETEKLGGIVDPGDSGALAQLLADAAENRDTWELRARAARERALQDFAPEVTLREFLAWCGQPRRAPDRDAEALTPWQRREAEGLGPRVWTKIMVEGELGPLLEDRVALANLRRKLPLRAWYAIRKHVKGK
ncbi:MAG: hypothetical protein PWP23_2117 [Candidatus Sumerlaeota bacterium]|nr:hypothetical protein [Candidatus Sumerlaeota bacterium]